MKQDFTIRVATDEDLPRIEELMRFSNTWVEGTDLEGSAQYWGLAEVDGKVMGAVQVRIGKPASSIDLLSLDPELSHRVRAEVVKGLTVVMFKSLYDMGVQYVQTTIEFSQNSFKRILLKRGCAIMGKGNVLVKRLR